MIDYSKFGRNYNLKIQLDDTIIDPVNLTSLPVHSATNYIEIKPPFTLVFDITRQTWSSQNAAHIEVYNLSEAHRNQIRFDNINFGGYRQMKLNAGYGSNTPLVFFGTITSAFSVREGSNFVTSLESFDGGYTYVNSTLDNMPPIQAGTPVETVLRNVVAQMPGISFGAIGHSFDGRVVGAGDLGRANSFSGSAVELARFYSKGQFFIDNAKAYFLATNEVVVGQLQEINVDTGLLNTPTRQLTCISLDMLFTPQISCGQIINLNSQTDANFNGPYKVVGVKHRGMISPTVCGEAVTTVDLDNSKNTLNNNQKNLQIIQAG